MENYCIHKPTIVSKVVNSAASSYIRSVNAAIERFKPLCKMQRNTKEKQKHKDMILNIKLVGALFALLFIASIVTFAIGDYLISILCIIGLGLLSSHMKKYEKFYDSELNDIIDDDKFE